MHRKTDFSINKTADLEIEPALWVSLVGSALSITSSPYAVMIISGPAHFSHVTGVEGTREEDVGLPWLVEVESGALGDRGRICIRRWGGIFLHDVVY